MSTARIFNSFVYDYSGNGAKIGCPSPCQLLKYEGEMNWFNSESYIVTEFYDHDWYETARIIELSLESDKVEERSSQLIYDLGNFLAQLGGTLGLVNGFSCLTLYSGLKQIVIEKLLKSFR